MSLRKINLHTEKITEFPPNLEELSLYVPFSKISWNSKIVDSLASMYLVNGWGGRNFRFVRWPLRSFRRCIFCDQQPFSQISWNSKDFIRLRSVWGGVNSFVRWPVTIVLDLDVFLSPFSLFLFDFCHFPYLQYSASLKSLHLLHVTDSSEKEDIKQIELFLPKLTNLTRLTTCTLFILAFPFTPFPSPFVSSPLSFSSLTSPLHRFLSFSFLPLRFWQFKVYLVTTACWRYVNWKTRAEYQTQKSLKNKRTSLLWVFRVGKLKRWTLTIAWMPLSRN